MLRVFLSSRAALSAAVRAAALDVRFMATVTQKLPQMAESISEGTVQKWLKKDGQAVELDEIICNVETDKTVYEFRAKQAGVIVRTLVKEGETVRIDQAMVEIDTDGKPSASAAASSGSAAQPAAAAAAAPAGAAAAPKPSVDKLERAPSSPLMGGAAPAAGAKAAADEPAKPAAAAARPAAAAAPSPGGAVSGVTGDQALERRVPMSRMRQRIAERLKTSQATAAMLTTFNEVNMHNLIQLRTQYKDAFEKKHGARLGLMSAFVKAAAAALKEHPVVNAVIDGTDIVYRDYVDISVAVSTPTGLIVPVLRDVDRMSFADVEKTITDLGNRARDNKVSIAEMQGGTFTISNGGVFGSMMGTPIINPPQSAVLGMHGVVKRAVVENDEIVVRPMMYVALTYDHRLIDGRDGVLFLRHIKECVEDPRRLLLDL